MKKGEEPPRRFFVGWRTEIGGIEYHVVKGKKCCRDCEDAGDDPALPCGHDLCMEAYVATGPQEYGGWRPQPIDTLAMLCDFYYENEHFLYTPPRYEGGMRVIHHLRLAVAQGYQAAAEKLQRERERAAQRRRSLQA